MIVLGNDLINLNNRVNTNTLCRAGIEKFFTPKEMHLLELTGDVKTLACLWAMKESAYKCLVKLGFRKAFSPAKYHVKTSVIEKPLLGEVTYGEHVFYAKCSEDGDFIRAVATNEESRLSQIKSFHICFHGTENKNEAIAAKIKKINHSDPLELSKTDQNIPVLMNKRKTHRLEISMANEGKLYYVSVLPEWFRITNQKVGTGKIAYA
ncbi:MAG TPA: 4'-phosphopantetheinyl transferase superfamily protein [Bacteroidales bacterium]|nr:4'-phosphopantetheinyl transferase superfamily protein [Bacteroidales bacterium]